jgi:predicted PurR-regulated permease PerM
MTQESNAEATPPAQYKVPIVYRHAVVITLLVAIAAGSILLAWELRVLLLDLILALTVASAIAPIAEMLEKKGISRAVTVICVYGLVLFFYAGVGFALAVPLSEQAKLLAEQLPRLSLIIQDWWSHILSIVGDKVDALDIHATDLREPVISIAKKTLSLTAGFMGLALNAVLTLFLAAYFVIEANHIWDKLLLWLPKQHRTRARSLINPLAGRMGGYVRGQLLVSTAVAAVFAVGFTVIGLKYGLVLGIVAGVLNLIPYVGSLTATFLALFIAASDSLQMVGLTFAVFALEQLAETNFIVPLLLGKNVDMHPLVVMFSILIGGSLAGAAGALAAVPSAAAILLLAQEFYFKPLNDQPLTDIASEASSVP